MSADQAVALFDSLEPATEENMLGRWRGVGINTNHPMDGLLEAASWYGKIFENREVVHPLVHKVWPWGELMINPALVPVRLVSMLPGCRWIFPLALPFVAPILSTRRPQARLSTIEFRGRAHAAMIYNTKPITDVFARFDQTRVIGWMDYHATERPFFFALARDTTITG